MLHEAIIISYAIFCVYVLCFIPEFRVILWLLATPFRCLCVVYQTLQLFTITEAENLRNVHQSWSEFYIFSRAANFSVLNLYRVDFSKGVQMKLMSREKIKPIKTEKFKARNQSLIIFEI